MKTLNSILLLSISISLTGCTTKIKERSASDKIDQRIVNNSEVCQNLESLSREKIKPVKVFKDSLDLRVLVTKSHSGLTTYLDTVRFSQRIKDESSVIKISERVALRICLVRAQLNEKKHYLYTLILYLKEQKYWKALETTPDWHPFNLGSVTGGYSRGEYGTNDAIGFVGEITIK